MRRFVTTSSRAVALDVAAALTLTATAAAQPVDPTYQQLKNLQGLFPIPTPSATVQVGTFNPQSGGFTGLKSTPETDPGVPGAGGNATGSGGRKGNESDPLIPQPKPTTIPIPPQVNVNAVNVTLTWSLSPAGPAQVTSNGVTVKTQGSQSSISIDVGTAGPVKWTITSGSRTYSDLLIINRPPLIGVGAFTIPALPLTVIYDPPQYTEGKNIATYSETKSLGTTMRVSFQRQDSTTVPTPGRFNGTKQFQNVLQAIGDLLSVVGLFTGGGGGGGGGTTPGGTNGSAKSGGQGPGLGSVLGTIGKGLKLLEDALGSTNATTQTGVQVTNDQAISIQAVQQEKFTTGSHDGPGVGDRILYLKNARMAWALAPPNGVQLMLLGSEALAADAVSVLAADLAQLQSAAKAPSSSQPSPTAPVGQKTGLDQATLQALLALDPFVAGGPGVSLTAPAFHGRFVFVVQYEWSGSGDSGGGDTFDFSTTLTQSQLSTTTNFVVNTEDDKKGFLAFLGLGVTDDQSTRTSIQNSHSQEVDDKTTVESTVQLFAAEGERHAIAGYYDTVFGAYAFQDVPQGQAFVAGVLKDERGNPQAGLHVYLSAGGKKYVTRTDAQGSYEFRSADLKPGTMTLSAGSVLKQIDASKGPVRGVAMAVAR
jgi:hypothetical protein